MRAFSGFTLLLLFLVSSMVHGEIIPGQMVSWTDYKYITTITYSDEIVYYGTTNGILRMDRYTHEWQDPISASDGLRGDRINRLAVTPDDVYITVETNQGIYTYDDLIENWYLETSFPTEYVKNSTPHPPLPILHLPPGYNFFPEGIITDSYLRQFQITAFLDDQFETVFIGTWGLGPALADNHNFGTDILTYGLLQKSIDVIYREGDSLWLAGTPREDFSDPNMRRYGVTLFNMARERFSYLEPRFISGFDSEIIFDIAGDSENLYFAGQQGLTLLNRDKQTFYTLHTGDGLPGGQATALASRGDTLWVGTDHGLGYYTNGAEKVRAVSRKQFGNLFVTKLRIVRDKLFVGTTSGTNYVDFASGKVGRLQDPQGILTGLIRDITVHGGKALFSSDRGLTEVDIATGKVNDSPLLNQPNGAYAAVTNEKYVAAAIPDGLLLIERETGKERTFTVDDGLLSNNVNTILEDGDYLWLGSDEGLTRFQWINPERVD
jgi:hypothetical protein